VPKQKANRIAKKSLDAKAPSNKEIDEVGKPIKSVFRDYRWPAGKQALIQEARLHTWLDRELLDRLQQIPDREYGSTAEVVEAVRAVAGQHDGAVGRPETMEANRLASGSLAGDRQPSRLR
jgi:hypothetical protein